MLSAVIRSSSRRRRFSLSERGATSSFDTYTPLLVATLPADMMRRILPSNSKFSYSMVAQRSPCSIAPLAL